MKSHELSNGHRPPGRAGRRVGDSGMLAALMRAAIIAVFAFTATLVTAAEYQDSSEGILSMSYAEGLLSLQTRDAPIGKVLEAISRLADLTIHSDGTLEGNVTVYVVKQKPETAMKKILRGRDVTFLFARNPDTQAGDYRLKEVRIFLPEGGQGQEKSYSYRKETQPATPAGPAARPRPVPGWRRPPPASGDQNADTSSAGPGPETSPQPGDEAQNFVTNLMEGNMDALNEMAERLKRENPEAGEQIDQVIDSLSEARRNAGEGNPTPFMRDLGHLGVMMDEMGKGRD